MHLWQRLKKSSQIPVVDTVTISLKRHRIPPGEIWPNQNGWFALVVFAYSWSRGDFLRLYQSMILPTETFVLPIIMQLICKLASARVCAMRFLAWVNNSLELSLMLPLSKCRNKSVAQTRSTHHGYGIPVKFLMCQSPIFLMIYRRAQCVVHRAGSAVTIVQLRWMVTK